MTTNTPDNTNDSGLVPARNRHLSSLGSQFPEILSRAGPAALFAAEEFFFGRIRNAHTRSAYRIAIRRFLVWAEARGLELVSIAPKDVGQYLDGLRQENTSVATRKQHLAAIRRGSFYHAGDQWMLHYEEKGGKSREIPVRHDLQEMIFEYLDAAGLRNARKDTPLFRTAYKKTGQLTKNPMAVVDICRMVKRRPRDPGLPSVLSPHSFRVTTITDLLEQGVPLEDVQRLAGHADPRTTRLYDRRQKKITRNIVERISI